MNLIRLVLIISSAALARPVEVQVSDAHGVPIRGATVRPAGTDIGPVTDERGTASIDLPGATKLLVTHERYLSATLEASTKDVRIAVRLELGGTVRGVVFDEGSQPMQGVQLTFANQRLVTGADGRFEFAGVPPGHHRLSCALPNDESALACLVQHFEVTPASTFDTNLHAYPLDAELSIATDIPVRLVLERSGHELPHSNDATATSISARVPSGTLTVRLVSHSKGIVYKEKLTLTPGQKIERRIVLKP